MLLSRHDQDPGGSGRREWRYAADDALVAVEARVAFCDHLRLAGCPFGFVEMAQIVFGELVGNVVRHAPGPIGISLTWCGDEATLSVIDSAPCFHSRQALPADPLSDAGRGLFIVRTLTDGFAIDPLPGGGKAIRVKLQI